MKGELSVVGTESDPIVSTSVKDDSVGRTSNGDRGAAVADQLGLRARVTRSF